MNLSTPYLVYIIAAYGLSLSGLILFWCITLFQWKQSIRELTDTTHEA